MQFLKNQLVRLGPDSLLVRSALQFHARRRGFSVSFISNGIQITKRDQAMVLPKSQYVQVPFMIEEFDFYFRTIESKPAGNSHVLDFSGPAFHQYANNGIGFFFPSVPEDDVMNAYTHWHQPRPGEIVWDAGAHAGASTYFFSKMVGPEGKVYAFEPDEKNFQFLLKNIDLHHLENVVPVKKALAGETGSAMFNMDGSMSAGLIDYLVYSDKRLFKEVQTITLIDACAEFGSIPNFVKMDIEGAEVEVVRDCKSLLSHDPIHFAIESNHKVHGEVTARALERLFAEFGYKVHSSEDFGQLFTWAGPNIERNPDA